jgi:DNA-binding MarR family transcriptional regulator
MQTIADIAYDGAPTIVLIADHLPDGATIGIASAGYRIRTTLPPQEALAMLRDDDRGEQLLAWFAGTLGDGDEALLLALAARARDGRGPAIVVVPEAMIDLAYARLDDSGVRLMAGPSVSELAVALLAAIAPGGGVAEDDAEGDGRRLADLTSEVGRIARRLSALAGTQVTPPASRLTEAPAIRALIRARRRRDQLFGADLFADPAWDMLLDLAAARKEGRQVAVSSLCIASAVPATTALRWIQTLTAAGLFVRHADPDDRRRVFIALSDGGMEAVDACLSDGLRAILES